MAYSNYNLSAARRVSDALTNGNNYPLLSEMFMTSAFIYKCMSLKGARFILGSKIDVFPTKTVTSLKQVSTPSSRPNKVRLHKYFMAFIKTELTSEETLRYIKEVSDIKKEFPFFKFDFEEKCADILATKGLVFTDRLESLGDKGRYKKFISNVKGYTKLFNCDSEEGLNETFTLVNRLIKSSHRLVKAFICNIDMGSFA